MCSNINHYFLSQTLKKLLGCGQGILIVLDKSEYDISSDSSNIVLKVAYGEYISEN